MRGGFYEEAQAWRDWLLRAVAGDPSQMQIMYGVAGERRLDEWEVDWLPGLRGLARRCGSATPRPASSSSTSTARSWPPCYESAQRGGLDDRRPAWELQLALMDFLETGWREPDDGIWEVRGAAAALHPLQGDGLGGLRPGHPHAPRSTACDGPVDRWRAIRAGDPRRGVRAGLRRRHAASFTQYYGSDQLDASLLMIPLVGFLPATDPRVRGTIEAIERELVDGGFVLRYRTADTGDVDGLTGRRGGLPGLHVLAGRLPGPARAARRRPRSCSTGCSACATTSACCPRSTTRWPAGWWATSPRRSPTCRWSTRRPRSAATRSPVVEHVFLGLARQALTGSRPRGWAATWRRRPGRWLRELCRRREPDRAVPPDLEPWAGPRRPAGRRDGRPAGWPRSESATSPGRRADAGGHDEGHRRRRPPRRRPQRRRPPAKKAPSEDGPGEEGHRHEEGTGEEGPGEEGTAEEGSGEEGPATKAAATTERSDGDGEDGPDEAT